MLLIVSFLTCILSAVFSFPFFSSTFKECVEGTEAEKIFLDEMWDKINRVKELSYQQDANNAKFKSFLSIKTVLQFWNYYAKIKLALSVLWNVFKRGRLEIQLNQAKKALTTELFLKGFWVKSEQICKHVFQHSFFKEKGWRLIEDDASENTTAANISVSVNDQLFERPTKTCTAKSSSSDKKFVVNVSAANGFNWKKNFVFFVFNKMNDGKYKVIAYLTKK